MSVLNKIKEITENAENLAKEKSVVTITSDSHMLIENYISLKLFTDDKLLVEMDDFDLYVSGAGLVIDFFSPSRLMLRGEIRSIAYLSESVTLTEEL